MSNAGIPLRIIQEISGHRTLDELYKYLEVKPEQVKGAIASLSMLTPVEKENFVKSGYNEVPLPPEENKTESLEGKQQF
jgi:integrase/recombinase XerD